MSYFLCAIRVSKFFFLSTHKKVKFHTIVLSLAEIRTVRSKFHVIHTTHPSAREPSQGLVASSRSEIRLYSIRPNLKKHQLISCCVAWFDHIIFIPLTFIYENLQLDTKEKNSDSSWKCIAKKFYFSISSWMKRSANEKYVPTDPYSSVARRALFHTYTLGLANSNIGDEKRKDK